MSAGIDEITQLALMLPAEQRAQVASALLDSLDNDLDSAEVHEAWTAELVSRADNVTSGRVEMLSRDEVRAQLAADRVARQQR